jgi:hypothetical protein
MLDFETRAYVSEAIQSARDFASAHKDSLFDGAAACAAVVIVAGTIFSAVPLGEPAPSCEPAQFLPLSRDMPTAAQEREWTWPIAGEQQADEPAADEEEQEPRRRRRHGRRG